MWRTLLCCLFFLAFLAPLRATEEGTEKDVEEPVKVATPAEQYEALAEGYTEARRKFFEVYRKADSNEDRQKLVEEIYPKPADYSGKMVQLASDHADDPAAVDALVWVVINGGGPDADKARELLAQNHIESPKLVQVCQRMMYDTRPASHEFLRSALEKNPNEEVKGWACYGLAKGMLRAQPRQTTDSQESDEPSEAERLMERVIEEFSSVKTSRGGTLSELAEADLFELRNLAIGCVAPVIEGEDIEGVTFKLTDYRGKVVVLDFWGNW